MSRLRFVPAVAAAALLLLTTGACARADAGSTGPGTSARTSPAPDSPASGDLVLRVELTGGFVPPQTLITRLPVISVYADGRVITEGPQDLIYPPRALPNLQQRRISAADVEKLVELAERAGIGGPEEDYGSPPVSDLASTRFTVVTDAGRQVVEVYALDHQGSMGLTPAQVAARQKLRDLIEALNDLPATLGADAVGEPEAYRPAAVAATAQPWTPDSGDPTEEQEPRNWPGPDLPGDGDSPAPCVTATGAQAEAVLAAAAQANILTPWISAGQRWRVDFRPLLPDESSCADLGD